MVNRSSRKLKCLKLDFFSPSGKDVPHGGHFLSTGSVVVICFLINDKQRVVHNFVPFQ